MTDRHVGRGRPRLTATITDLEVVRQRAMLAGLIVDGQDVSVAEASLDELVLLTDTAGSEVVSTALQRRDHPHPATYFGSGKVDQLSSESKALDIDVLVVDGELNPIQQRNLQSAFECDVVDRIALILDIFAQHATRREGMAQVELAMLRYRLPRLRGRGTEMSRLGGGIGTRGPGETQLETDRRRVLGRISQLEDSLDKMRITRDTQRKARLRSGMASIALVGYTNAGKSSLLNRLTEAEVLVEDRLFSTLEATTRRVDLPGGRVALLSDTVGFVRDLPHTLVEAFRSTLEEATDTDLLLHVVDASADDPDGQIAAVRTTLREIGSADRPELLVINKVDVATPEAVGRLLAIHPEAVAVSAFDGTGMEALLTVVEEKVTPELVEIHRLFPYDRGDLIAALHRVGEVLSEEHGADGVIMRAMVSATEAGQFGL
ncbi:GTPase HflX [bacterium]|nr:GTPase HflX [bacterium]